MNTFLIICLSIGAVLTIGTFLKELLADKVVEMEEDLNDQGKNN